MKTLGVCIFAYCGDLSAGALANAAEFADSPAVVRVAAANSSEAARSAADFVCTGTNDEAVLTKAIEGLVRGGTVKLADGDYWIDAFPYEGNSAVYFGYNDGLTRVVTVEGTTEGKVYGAYRGAALHDASARVGMFASRISFSQLSKNESFSTEKKRLVLHYTSA